MWEGLRTTLSLDVTNLIVEIWIFTSHIHLSNVSKIMFLAREKCICVIRHTLTAIVVRYICLIWAWRWWVSHHHHVGTDMLTFTSTSCLSCCTLSVFLRHHWSILWNQSEIKCWLELTVDDLIQNWIFQGFKDSLKFIWSCCQSNKPPRPNSPRCSSFTSRFFTDLKRHHSFKSYVNNIAKWKNKWTGPI